MLKIDQSVFIHNFVKEERLRDYYIVSTLMKAENFIKMQSEDDYKEVDLKIYQRLIGKLI